MIDRNAQQKRIQLRGLSYVPSNRITKDGGCSESLNLQCEEGGDLVPMLKPVDADLGLPASGVTGKVLYIHTQPEYKNVITYVYTEEQGAHPSYVIKAYNEGQLIPMDEVFFLPESATSIGNTVIISGTPMEDGFSGNAYFLYKNVGGNKMYKYLGDHIPVPELKFAPEEVETADYDDWVEMSESEKATTSIGSVSHIFSDDEAAVAAKKVFGLGNLPIVIRSGAGATELEEETRQIVVTQLLYKFENWSQGVTNKVIQDCIKTVVDRMWAQIEEGMNYNSVRGMLNMPVFVRYAIRLYDGSHYGVSIPILVAPCDAEQDKDIIHFELQNVGDQYGTAASGSDPDYTVYVPFGAYEFTLNYILGFSLLSGINHIDDWGDLIESVDIFVSKMVTPYPDKTRIKMDESSVTHSNEKLLAGDNDFYTRFHATGTLDPWGLYDLKEQEKNILGYSNFYLIKSYSLDEFKALSANTWISLQDDMNMDPDHLSVLETLKEADAYQSEHKMITFDSSSYNKRLLAWNVEQRLSAGYPKTHTSMLDPSTEQYEIWYHINTGEGIERVVYGGIINDEQWYSWIAYPDSRCDKVTFKWLNPPPLADFSLGTIKMKPHPSLNIAYAFCGLDYRIVPTDTFFTEVEDEPTEDNVEHITGQLIQSESSNPWKFPASGRVTVGDGEIVGVATVAKPLSSGQFGQFPLYVFTSEGVWALTLNSEGVFTTATPVSRDVAQKGSITPLDQAVAFITDKGVMMLAGSDVRCASETLYGKSDTPDIVPDTILSSMQEQWSDDLAAQIEDTVPFMQFIKEAKIAYDYAGKRILVFNPLYAFMYVYMLAENTWHRMDAGPTTGLPENALNSYPDCDIVCRKAGTGIAKIFRFSQYLYETNSQQALPCAFVTRPITFEELDIYKSIRHLLVRRETDSSSVLKYILMASDDLRTWEVMHSLKGPSHKYYRVAVIADLSPGDRIDYLEFEYVRKFLGRPK